MSTTTALWIVTVIPAHPGMMTTPVTVETPMILTRLLLMFSVVLVEEEQYQVNYLLSLHAAASNSWGKTIKIIGL